METIDPGDHGDRRFFMTLLEKADRFPPVLCRLSARDGRGLLSTRKLARRAGLSKSLVAKISVLTSWESVSFGVAMKFAEACDVNLMSTRKRRELLKTRSWGFLAENVSSQQRALIMKLLTNAQQAVKRAA